ncbi:hypothetical protein [Proteus phage vB_PmiM_ZX7]|nr:hypothetical protein [Proteus phage vB_PmiM_ZX7]
MTEFEINKAVAEKLGMEFPELIDKDSYYPLTYFTEDGKDILSFNPCNNVEQAWEIMMKYNIGVIKNYYDDTWISVSSAGQIEHKNPLIAAMICFLEL